MLLLASGLWVCITYLFRDIIKNYALYILYPFSIFTVALTVLLGLHGLGGLLDYMVIVVYALLLGYYIVGIVLRRLGFKDTLIIPLLIMILTLLEAMQG